MKLKQKFYEISRTIFSSKTARNFVSHTGTHTDSNTHKQTTDRRFSKLVKLYSNYVNPLITGTRKFPLLQYFQD